MGKKIDATQFIGRQYGNLTILSQDKESKKNKVVCKCKCGRVVSYPLRDLRYGATTSCGCKGRVFDEYIGKRYSKLTIMKCYMVGKKMFVDCLCDCGNTITTEFELLHNQRVNRCNKCLPKTLTKCSSQKHSKERLYKIWRGILTRCYNPNNHAYKHYGERGIRVCEEWQNDYMTFREWALDNGFHEDAQRNECSVERKDVDGNYEPSNCTIIPMKYQRYNKRTSRKLEYNGEIHCVAEWISLLGLNRETVWNRVKRGLPVEDILYKGNLKDKRKPIYKREVGEKL